MAKILLVEDDSALSESLVRHLTLAGFAVTACATLQEALKASPSAFDLLLLDWELPDGEGIDLLQHLRSKKNAVPVIFLTSRTEIADKLLGFESGADDFVEKPFDARELTARIRNRLRLSNTTPPQSIEVDNLKIDIEARKVWLSQREIEFSKTEFDLLKCLMQNAGRALARQEIAHQTWGIQNLVSSRTIDTHVLNLRQKIGEHFIETLRGVGYRFKAKQ